MYEHDKYVPIELPYGPTQSPPVSSIQHLLVFEQLFHARLFGFIKLQLVQFSAFFPYVQPCCEQRNDAGERESVGGYEAFFEKIQ